MYWKFQVLILLLLAISPMISAMLSTSSVVPDLVKVAENLFVKIFKQHPRKTLFDVQHMNDDLQHQLQRLTNIFSSEISILEELSHLQKRVDNIGFAFKNAVEKRIYINANRSEDRDTYENFVHALEYKLDEDISEIYRLLLDGTSESYIKKSLFNDLSLYDIICISGKSKLQLFSNILVNMKVATIQYYLTKQMMYDFLEPYAEYHKSLDFKRTNLRKFVEENYNKALLKFKAIMANASQELWRCDADVRATNPTNGSDYPYFELTAFTKYIFNEGIFENSTNYSKQECSAITKVDECQVTYRDYGNFCKNTRKCPHNLVGCKNYHTDHDQKTYVCFNNDKTALNRYMTLMPINQFNYVFCHPDKIKQIQDVNSNFFQRLLYGYKEWYNFCDCLCEEKYYYISTVPTYADYANNKVVIGVKLVVEDDTIYIQIKQGSLKADGLIDDNTIEWVPIQKDDEQRVQITWEGYRSIDLTSTKLDKEYSVVGLSFAKRYNMTIGLITYACQFNFTVGTNLCPSSDHLYTTINKSPERELVLDNMDRPVNAMARNRPDSDDNQFLKFTTTGEKEDGAQTTIPFIDTQELVTNPPVPLGGIGFIHRGQPGFGGFLALKIYTYNVALHIPDSLDVLSD